MLLFHNTYGQNNAFTDTISDAFRQRKSLDLRLDSRTSFITNRPAQIMGVKLGIAFGEKIKVGVGYNWLRTSLLRTRKQTTEIGQLEYQVGLKLRYVSPYFEYTYYSSDKLELTIPVMVGLGSTHHYSLANEFRNQVSDSPSFILFYEPYSIGLYKPVPWFGIGFGVGYRLVLIGGSRTNENLNSPIYVFKVKLLMKEIFKYFESR